MRLERLFAVLTVVIVVTLLPSPLSAAAMKPGRWEITMQTLFPESKDPAAVRTTPATSTIVCISNDNAERPKPPKAKDGDDCKVTGPGLIGNVLAYSIRCTKQEVSSEARFTYTFDRYEGLVITSTEYGEVRQAHTARYVGECDPAEQEGALKP